MDLVLFLVVLLFFILIILKFQKIIIIHLLFQVVKLSLKQWLDIDN